MIYLIVKFLTHNAGALIGKNKSQYYCFDHKTADCSVVFLALLLLLPVQAAASMTFLLSVSVQTPGGCLVRPLVLLVGVLKAIAVGVVLEAGAPGVVVVVHVNRGLAPVLLVLLEGTFTQVVGEPILHVTRFLSEVVLITSRGLLPVREGQLRDIVSLGQ